MKNTLLFSLLLLGSSLSAQLKIQTFEAYNAQNGELAAEKLSGTVAINVNNKRITRPAILDLFTYRFQKEALRSGLIADVKDPVRVFVLIKFGKNYQAEEVLYKASGMKISKNRVEETNYPLSAADQDKLLEVVVQSMALTDFETSGIPLEFVSSYFFNIAENKKAKHLEMLRALPDTTTKINLSSYDLTEVPDEIYRFSQLKELLLSDNQISILPPRLWKIKTLEKLDVSKNVLGNKSLKIRKGNAIKTLNVQYNYLSKAPKGMHKLREMNHLLLGNNLLSDFHKQRLRHTGNIQILNLYNAGLVSLPSSLNRFTALEELDLYHNQLKTIDLDFDKLSRLKTLAISHNGLWKLPEGLTKLPDLQVLYAHHNKIDRLPELSGSIKLLDVGYNDFTRIPEGVYKLKSLEQVDFSNCNLEEVPVNLAGMPSLQKVYISNNPLEKDGKLLEEYKVLVDSLQERAVQVK